MLNETEDFVPMLLFKGFVTQSENNVLVDSHVLDFLP